MMQQNGRSEHYNLAIPKLYLHNTITHLCFAWISAKVQHGVKINEAAIEFQEFMGADEDSLSLESILQCYYRCGENFRDFKRYDNIFANGYKSNKPQKNTPPKQAKPKLKQVDLFTNH